MAAVPNLTPPAVGERAVISTEQKPEANRVRLRRIGWVRDLLGGISARSVGRLAARGLLPAPVKASARLSLWPEAEVVESVERLLADRRTAAAAQFAATKDVAAAVKDIQAPISR
jgi:predicted DNA-binding transcriptional regulator AlpA